MSNNTYLITMATRRQHTRLVAVIKAPTAQQAIAAARHKYGTERTVLKTSQLNS